jgi:hypothetical protein
MLDLFACADLPTAPPYRRNATARDSARPPLDLPLPHSLPFLVAPCSIPFSHHSSGTGVAPKSGVPDASAQESALLFGLPTVLCSPQRQVKPALLQNVPFPLLESFVSSATRDPIAYLAGFCGQRHSLGFLKHALQGKQAFHGLQFCGAAVTSATIRLVMSRWLFQCVCISWVPLSNDII